MAVIYFLYLGEDMSKSVITKRKVDHLTGEITETEHVTSFRREAPFVKMYTDDLSLLYELQHSGMLLLYEIAIRIDFDGLVSITGYLKKCIAERLGISVKTIDNTLTSMVKKGIMIRRGRGVFEMNPLLFAKGTWQDIKRRREIWFTIVYKADGTREISSGVE